MADTVQPESRHGIHRYAVIPQKMSLKREEVQARSLLHLLVAVRCRMHMRDVGRQFCACEETAMP